MATRINRYIDSVSAYESLEVSLIQFSENSLRRGTQNVSDLVESIRENGLMQPIVVRPRGKRFEVVAGNRRLMACRQLKHHRVKAMVIELDDKTAYELALIENIQRKTLDPIEEATAFKKYCEEFGWGSQTELARKIGKSQEYISHRIKLLSLPDSVKNALSAKEISLSSAQEIVWMENDNAKEKLLPFLSQEKLDIHDVRKLVQTIGSKDSPNVEEMFREKDYSLKQDTIDYIEQEFVETVSESILIIRIALVRIDDIISRTKDQKLKQILVEKRIALHTLADELVSVKKHGLLAAPLVARAK